MALRRYALILRRWIWLLLLAVGCAALLSWVYVKQAHLNYDARLVVIVVTLAGLVWGLAGIFGIEYLRDQVKTADDVRHITSARIIGTVGIDPRRAGPSLFEDSPGSSSDAYRAIAAQLLRDVSDAKGEGKAVLICSTQSGPQSARIAANVAAAAARLGHSVLLVDANRQEGDLTKSLALGGEPGFADSLLRSGVDVPIHVAPGMLNLHILPAGVYSLHQPLSFAEARLRRVLDPSNGHRSLVVVAGPPFGTQPDWLALGLARSVDRVVMVVVGDSTRRNTLRRAVTGLHEAQARPGGIIFVQRKPPRNPQYAVPPPQLPAPAEAPAIGESLAAPAAPNAQLPVTQAAATSPTEFEPKSTETEYPSPSTPSSDAPDTLGATPQPDAQPISPGLDLPDLDSMGGELARSALRGTVHVEQPADSAEAQPTNEQPETSEENQPQAPEQPEPGLREPIPIGSARRGGPVSSTRTALAPSLDIEMAPAQNEPLLMPVTPDLAPAEEAEEEQSQPVEQATPREQPASPPQPGAPTPTSPQAPGDIAARDFRPAATSVSVPVSGARSPTVTIDLPPKPEAVPELTAPTLPPTSVETPTQPVVLSPTSEQADAVQAPRLAAKRQPSLESEPPRLVALASRWMAALSIRRDSRSLRRGREERAAGLSVDDNSAPTLGLGARLQLAIGGVVRRIPGRSTPDDEEIDNLPGAELANSSAPFLMSSALPEGDRKIFETWLSAAEHARQRGNRKEAKQLINRVLDRDPHNEAAWQLRLRLDEPEDATQRWDVPARQRSTLLPVILLAGAGLVALVAVGIYLGRSQLSGLSSGNPAPTATRLPSSASQPTPANATPIAPSYEVGAPFLSFWSGNKSVFGQPISPLVTETGSDGSAMTVQYFDRARLELHPKNNGTEFEVTVGRLGAEVPPVGSIANPLPEGLRGEQVTLKQDGISTPQKFNAFWQANGGIAIFGYPITPVLYVTTPGGGKMAVQYFERARLEYHPGSPNEIQLTNLGKQVYQAKHGSK